jgi:hypothetical protein
MKDIDILILGEPHRLNRTLLLSRSTGELEKEPYLTTTIHTPLIQWFSMIPVGNMHL